jgi:hypothetical protein
MYGKWVASGGKTVDQVEANRRATICESCPANQRVKENEKGPGCCGGKWVSVVKDVPRAVAAALTWPMVKNKTTPSDAKLYTCTPCGCPLRTKVWVPLEVLSYSPSILQSMEKTSGGKCWNLAS